MPLGLLLDYRAWLVAAIIGLGLYATIQRLQKEQVKAEFAQYRADVDRLASESKVKNAQEAAQQAQNAQEVLDALQGRYVALNARYRSLREHPAGGSTVPSISSAAPSFAACPGVASEPDAAAGRLADLEGRVAAILETGDREIAKYRELWALQEKNSERRQ